MKKIILFMLAAMMIFAAVPVSAANGGYAAVSVFDTADDVKKWKIGKWGGDDVKDSNINSDYVMMGNYSLDISNVSNSGNQYSVLPNLSMDTMGYGYVNFWIYDATPDFADGVRARFSYGLDGKGGSQALMHTFVSGKQLVSLPITAANQGKKLTELRIGTEGYGMTNSTDEYKNKKIYIGGVFMSETLPKNPEFSGTSVKEGATLVKTNIGKVDFKGDSFMQRSINSADITIEPQTDFTVSVKEDTLSVVFDADLEYGTDYKITVNGGILNTFGMEYNSYELNFRTRGENENIPPEVELTGVASGQRFFPNEPITLSARAYDDNGTIEYVEFYADDVLIDGSRVTSDSGIFTFEWICEDDSLTPKEITAAACDNDGAVVFSTAVKILVASLREPKVSITSPTDGENVYKSLSGVIQSDKIKLETEMQDDDGEITLTEIYMDDTLVHSGNGVVTEYTFDNIPDKGEHTIYVYVTDNDNQTSSASVSVVSRVMGKKFPALMSEQLNNKDYFAKWSKTGSAEFNLTDNGIEVNRSDAKENTISRTYIGGLAYEPWQADISVIPHDTSVFSVKLSGAVDVAEFKNDGMIYPNGSDTGIKYNPNEKYTLSVVANPISSKASILLNGKMVSNDVKLTTSALTGGLTVQILFKSTGETVISDYMINKFTDAAEMPEVKVFADGTEQNLQNVSVNASYIKADGLTINSADDVYVENTYSGEKISAELKDGKICINEILKSDCVYNVVFGRNVYNAKGAGFDGESAVSFKTEKKDINNLRDKTYFECGGVKTEEIASNDLKFVITIENTEEQTKNAEIVLVVYDGDYARKIVTEKVVLNTGENEFSVSTYIDSLTDDTYAEAFVVESMETMKPIGDTVFKIQ